MEYSMDWLSNDVCEGFANVGISCSTTEANRMYNQNPSQHFRCDKSTFLEAPFLDNSHHHSQNGVNEGHGGMTLNGHMNDAGHNRNINGMSNPSLNEAANGNAYHEEWDLAGNPKKVCRDIKSEYEPHNIEAADSTAELNFKKREQKRRPKPKDGSMLMCQICGDRALGYNFDAITCESCKAFFRRNALKTKVFTCSFEGNCKLDPHTRKFCSGCRLKKCMDVGMKKDWILSDDQLAKRRKKNSRSSSSEDMKFPSPPPQMTMAPHLSSSSSPMTYCPPHKIDLYSPPGSSTDGEINSTNYMSDSTEGSSISSPTKVPYLNFSPSMVKTENNELEYPRPLPADLALEIQLLEKEYKAVFDSGYSEDQAKKMMEKPHNANDLFNMTDIFIRRLIKFAKHIPEFKTLKQEDQIYLLKGGIMEIMVLRSAMGFDPNQLKWSVKQQQDSTEHKIDPSIIKEQLGTAMYTEHVKFVKGLHQITNSDRTVMTLLFVIEIFTPDRSNLRNIEGVSDAQDKYTGWLRTYLESLMPAPKAQQLCKEMLMKLLEVRNLGESSAKLAANLDITKLEPLLIEVFSLQK